MTMRIACLAQSYPPMISGAAISAQQTVEAMAQRGHKVLVVAASDRGVEYHTYKENLTTLRLRSFINPFRVGQRLMAHPRFKVMKALDQFLPDVIHVHEPLQMGELALKYANRTRVPVLLATHQLPWFVASYLPRSFKPITEKTLWMYARISMKRYAALITPTRTIAKIIEQQTDLKSNVISYGLDIRMFHPPLPNEDGTASRRRLYLPPDVPLILYVGRLDSDKRVDKVIHAAAQAVQESEAHLLVVGDGTQKQNLIRLCKRLGIGNRAHFTGFVSPPMLPAIYRMANVFATASEIETQGIVLLEAAASGLPIVAVNATCISETVQDQINGFLVEPGDTASFSRAIVDLLHNPQKAWSMGRQGRCLAETHDIRHTWTMHENLYQEMINRSLQEAAKRNEALFDPWKAIKTWME